jgi:hypothetical protein
MRDNMAQAFEESPVFRQGLLEALGRREPGLAAGQPWQEWNESYRSKLELSREIFEECGRLVRDSELQGWLLASENRGPAFSIGGLFINGGRWAHTADRGKDCWSRLYLQNAGGKPVLRYWAGKGWNPSGPDYAIADPQELAGKLSYAYLRELRDSLKSGAVGRKVKDGHNW